MAGSRSAVPVTLWSAAGPAVPSRCRACSSSWIMQCRPWRSIQSGGSDHPIQSVDVLLERAKHKLLAEVGKCVLQHTARSFHPQPPPPALSRTSAQQGGPCSCGPPRNDDGGRCRAMRGRRLAHKRVHTAKCHAQTARESQRPCGAVWGGGGVSCTHAAACGIAALRVGTRRTCRPHPHAEA